jgi:hypothetical protein
MTKEPLRGKMEGTTIINIDEVYEEILPYLADPKSMKQFLDKNTGRSGEELIAEVSRLMEEADVPQETDFRILLNALMKRF